MDNKLFGILQKSKIKIELPDDDGPQPMDVDEVAELRKDITDKNVKLIKCPRTSRRRPQNPNAGNSVLQGMLQLSEDSKTNWPQQARSSPQGKVGAVRDES